MGGGQETWFSEFWKAPDLKSSGFSTIPGLKQRQQRTANIHSNTTASALPKDPAKEVSGPGRESHTLSGPAPWSDERMLLRTMISSQAQAFPRIAERCEVTRVKIRKKTENQRDDSIWKQGVSGTTHAPFQIWRPHLCPELFSGWVLPAAQVCALTAPAAAPPVPLPPSSLPHHLQCPL